MYIANQPKKIEWHANSSIHITVMESTTITKIKLNKKECGKSNARNLEIEESGVGEGVGVVGFVSVIHALIMRR